MEYNGMSDSSGTDDDLLPPIQRNRFQKGGRAAGNMCAAVVAPAVHGDMDTQIHLIEQEAYCSIIRAFRAQSDAISWEKESLITELRKELRVSDEENRELLASVNADETIRRIREWRKSNASKPAHDLIPSPTVSASRKKRKISQSAAPLPPPPAVHPTIQPLLRAPPPAARIKKPKSMQHPSAGPTGRPQGGNRGPLGGCIGAFATNGPAETTSYDPLIGKKVWTRWPDDNNFYEAVITDYNAAESLHALVYDINTGNETWEWVNLKEISPGDIRWEGGDPGRSRKGSRPGPGHVVNKKSMAPRDGGGSAAAIGRGRGVMKSGFKKDGPLSQNGIGRKKAGDIRILHTETLIKEVEKVIGSNQPDPTEVEKAKKVLKEHEEALVDAISRLEDASDGESDGREHGAK